MADPTSVQQAPPRPQPTLQELLQGGITTATHVIKKQTRDCYSSYFKKFCEFCITNEYPDPAKFRHHELPSLLVAFMESVSSSSDVSNQTAEKIRAAVANYYGSYERRDTAGPDKWMVVTDENGNKSGLENPARDAFVRQFMRGLKKRKTSEFTQRQATPISLTMLRVLHSHLDNASGFTEASRLWFCAVSAFAFYGMCRINEVLSLQWKNLSLGMSRPSRDDPRTSIDFGSYKLEGRKTEVAEGRSYNLYHLDEVEKPINAMLHLRAWIEYVDEKTDHIWSDSDFVFPALSKISKSVLKSSSPLTGCENAHVQWGKKMTEQAFITLLYCAVRDLNRNGHHLNGYVRQDWRDIWFTSHTFRRAGAQYRFMFAPPQRRWSLRMVKWWAGWTQNESAETLVRYLLDQTASDEDKQLADCLAPDREAHTGCPTTYSGKKRIAAIPQEEDAISTKLQTRLKKVEASVAAVEDKLDILISLLKPTGQTNLMPASTEPTRDEQTSILPPAKSWKDVFQMYWKEDPSCHLFKPVYKWASQDKKQSGALPSRLSVAKLIGDDVAAFAAQKGVTDPTDIPNDVLTEYAAYYTKYWLPAGARIQQLADKATLKMICHRGFFVWSAGQADMSAAAREFCREVLDGRHGQKVVEAWLRRRAGKKLRDRWEAADPNMRREIMEANPDQTFSLRDAPIGIFDGRQDRQRYPLREMRVETPTVVEAPMPPPRPTVTSHQDGAAVNNLILQADKLRDTMARDVLTTELTYLTYWARERDAVKVAKKAAAVVDCLAARLGTIVGPAHRDEVLMCCKDIANHIASAPTMMAMSTDEEAVSDLEECRNVRIQSEEAACRFKRDAAQENECFKSVLAARTTFKPTHSDQLRHYDWLESPLEGDPDARGDGSTASQAGDTRSAGDASSDEGDDSGDGSGDSDGDGSGGSGEGSDSNDESSVSIDRVCTYEGKRSGATRPSIDGIVRIGGCSSNAGAGDGVDPASVLRSQACSNAAEHVKKRPRACVTQRSNECYYMG